LAQTDNKILMASDVQWRIFRPVCKEGLLLAGDAAAIIDPAAGQGIFNAMTSGIMAAHTVRKCWSTNSRNLLYWLLTTIGL
jgi:flavin-dependent dehydrogenase